MATSTGHQGFGHWCPPTMPACSLISSCRSPLVLGWQVFRSKDYNALLYAMGALFNKVEATKPQVCKLLRSGARG